MSLDFSSRASAPKLDFSDRAKPKPKVNPFVDAVGSYVGGLLDNAAGVADMVLGATPAGLAASTVRTAADLADGVSRVGSGQGGPRVVRNNAPTAATQFTTERTYKPKTRGGKAARSLGQNTLNAFLPGSTAARVANVVVPTATGEAFALGAEGMGFGEQGQENARIGGNVVGGFAASLRGNPFSQGAVTPLDQFADRARPDPALMRSRFDDMRAAGLEPTLTDVSGEPGRRVIRAVGVRSEQGGEALTNRATAATASVKPAAMERTAALTPDQRTPGQLAAALETARDEAASTTYAQPYSTRLTVPDSLKDMLSDEPGRAIIRTAMADAVENQDWPTQVELQTLLRPTENGQLPQVSARTLDRLAIAARQRGTAFAARPGRGMRAAGAFDRQGQINQVLDAAPGLTEARTAYRNTSQAIDVAGGVGTPNPFTTNPTDYAAWVQNLSPEARAANQVRVRQMMQDTLGRQRSNTFGTLDEWTTAPYAAPNLRTTFGEQADQFVANMTGRLAQARNASFVQPNAGSRTQVLANDVGNTAQNVVGGLRQAGSGDILGLAARAVDAWRSRGINPQQAEELARIAVDPNQTEAAIQAIAARLDPATRQQFLSLRNALPIATVAGTRQPMPSEAQ